MSTRTVWIVVPVFEREDSLEKFVSCLKYQTHQNYKLVVVDHGKRSLQIALNDPRVEIIRGSHKMWWTAAINRGIRHVLKDRSVKAETPVLIQNDDVVFGQDYISTLLEDWEGRKDSIVGSLCLDNDTHKIIRANIILEESKGNLKYFYRGKDLSSITSNGPLGSDVLTGRGTLIPASVFWEVGLYNERLLPHYRADNELIYRAKKKGYRIMVSTRAIVYSRLDSHYKLKNNLASKYKYLFDRKSLYNIKDLFFYSYLCFDLAYGTYFFKENLKRNIRRLTAESASYKKSTKGLQK